MDLTSGEMKDRGGQLDESWMFSLKWRSRLLIALGEPALGTDLEILTTRPWSLQLFSLFHKCLVSWNLDLDTSDMSAVSASAKILQMDLLPRDTNSWLYLKCLCCSRLLRKTKQNPSL